MTCDTPEQQDLFPEARSLKPCESRTRKKAIPSDKDACPARPEVAPVAPAWTGAPQYLTVKEVATYFAVSVPTVWRWAQSNASGFPAPIKLSQGVTRWRLQDIQRYEAQLGATAGRQ